MQCLKFYAASPHAINMPAAALAAAAYSAPQTQPGAGKSRGGESPHGDSAFKRLLIALQTACCCCGGMAAAEAAAALLLLRLRWCCEACAAWSC